MLELLPEIEAQGFEAAKWPPLQEVDVDGVRMLSKRGPDYHSVAERYWKLVHGTSAYTDAYEVFPEDPQVDGETFSPTGATYTAGSFSRATLAQVRRYLSLLPRGERFGDGYIAQQLQCGAFRAALERLRELRATI